MAKKTKINEEGMKGARVPYAKSHALVMRVDMEQ